MLSPTEDDGKGHRIFRAGRSLLNDLAAGGEIRRTVLRNAMRESCGEENEEWNWKDSYDAVEAAIVLFLAKYGRALLSQAGHGSQPRTKWTSNMLTSLLGLEKLEPPQTHRSETQERHQQFSTPLPIAWCTVAAADVRPDDRVLEPSAGIGILAAMAAWSLNVGDKGRLDLNELAATRSEMLAELFPQVTVTRANAERISNELPGLEPTVVVMNPPFSRSASVRKIRRNMDVVHVASAYRMLAPGGRLATVTSEGCIPYDEEWTAAFKGVTPTPSVLASECVAGRLYQKHGTVYNSRITVLEKPDGQEPEAAEPGTRAWSDPHELLARLLRQMPARRRAGNHRSEPGARTASARKTFDSRRRRRPDASQTHSWGPVGEIKYELVERTTDQGTDGESDGGPYRAWEPRTLMVQGAGDHPTKLVESTAMTAVLPPVPTYQPTLPLRITEEGQLSNAQVESVVLAGEAMSRHLPAEYRVSRDWEYTVRVDGAAPRKVDEDDEIPVDVRWQQNTVRYRRGWMLGDGTGTGKGRQVAGILIDQWLRGRRRGLWLSQSDKLVEDARRDWTALGGHGTDIVGLTRFRQGEPVPLGQGILFVTYATLRSPSRQDKVSRLEQIVDWLAGSTEPDDCEQFEGCLIFDESHAMAKAAGGKGSRGRVPPSQQGLAGMRLQNALPNARVVYVSATGASTVEGLAYAKRLGLWNSGEMPFEKREHFVQAMEAGGVAAMEVVARDLKALGLYQARALSYDGVEIEILRHTLTDEQRDIYNEYARAFLIIHQNLGAALKETGVSGEDGSGNPQAKAAACSAFEGAKQRFFGHLLTSMKMPTLLAAIRVDLEANHAPIVQLVSTGEALMERRLAEIPTTEWNDLSIDLTPREYILDYLRRAFPTQLYIEIEDDDGNVRSIPETDEHGDRVESVEAARRRDDLIERLASMPPVQGALDQLVQTLGHDVVAEITGRSRRVLRIQDARGERLALQPRAESANLAEAEAFMNGDKDVLAFSGAGNTGRSYHADKSCQNQKRRYHYLLEAGWRADQAIQGLGRSHRTHQSSAPVFRPVTTDVRGERRFISTIARRLDSLGAITRGQRNSQTAMGDTEDQALFHAADNFESPYARKALRQFYWALLQNKIPGQNLKDFEARTGLNLSSAFQKERAELPPMHTFLNRMLALEIDDQNTLFAEIERRIEANIEQAIESGEFNQGVETVRAESLRVVRQQTLHRNAGSGATTLLVEMIRRTKVRIRKSSEALAIVRDEEGLDRRAVLRVNTETGRAAVETAAASWMDEATGTVIGRARLYRPCGRDGIAKNELLASHWKETPKKAWQEAWDHEVENSNPYRDDRIWLATGLLLPIWDRLPDSNVKVWRVRTDDGAHLIGRLLNLGEVQQVVQALGSGAEIKVPIQELLDEILRGRSVLTLQNKMSIVARRVMGKPRVEIRGATHREMPWLKRNGCRTDIIANQLRVTIPTAEALETVLAQYPQVN